MKLVYNSISGQFDYVGTTGGGSGGAASWKSPVGTEAALPISGNTLGDARVATDTGNVFTWNGLAWINQSTGEATPLSVALSDGVTNQPLVIFNKNSESSVFLEYSIIRNSISENGEIQISTNGTDTSLAIDYGAIGSTGITLSTDIDGLNLRLLYTSTAIGFSGTFKYKVTKWGIS